MGFRDKYKDAQEQLKAAKTGGTAPSSVNLISDIGSRGEKLLKQNLQDGEHILAKIKGDFGQAFVVSDKHIFIVKWGFQSGSTFGGKCVSYSFPNVTAIQIKQQAVKCLVQVLTAATQDNQKLSYWGGRGKKNSALESDSAITFNRSDAATFQAAVNIAKQQMEQPKQATALADKNVLEMIKDLHERGVITDTEYKQKMRQALLLE